VTQEDGVEKFKALFIKIHAISIIWSAIIGAIAGILTALTIYLVLIHLIAASVYLLDLEHLTFKEIWKKLSRPPRTNGDIFRTMKESRQARKDL